MPAASPRTVRVEGGSAPQVMNLQPGAAPTVQQASAAQVVPEVRQVTLAETVSSMGHRASEISRVVNQAAMSGGKDEQLERHAARQLGQVDVLEREMKQMLEGLTASSYARASLAVDHYAAVNPNEMTVPQLKQRSAQALERAESESKQRKDIMSRKFSELFRATQVAQNSAEAEERRSAMHEASQRLSEIEEVAKALYEEEAEAARELAEEASRAFSQMDALQDSGQANYRRPGRGVISSTTLIEQMRERRQQDA